METALYPTPCIPAAQISTPNLKPGEIRRQKYKIVLYSLGISELVLSLISFIMGIATLARIATLHEIGYHLYYTEFLNASPSMWSVLPLVVSGVLGVCTKKNSSVCMFNMNMGFSITSSVFMGLLFFYSLTMIILIPSRYSGIVAMQAIICAVCVVSVIVCIVHSIYCCVGICCIKIDPGNRIVYHTQQYSSGPQYFQLGNGQYVAAQTPAVQPSSNAV